MEDSKFSWVQHGDEVTFNQGVSKILDFSIHPDYIPHGGLNTIGGYKHLFRNTDDIALLRIEPASDGYKETPISFRHKIVDGQSMIGAGWGLKEDGNIRFGIFLAEYKSHQIPTSTEFDAAYVGEGRSCNGDSGGPIFSKNGTDLELIGIIVYSGLKFTSCKKKDHTTAVKLSDYKKWITCTAQSLMGKEIEKECR